MLLAAVLLMSVSAMAQSSEPVRGDLNGDGEVNMSDVMFLVQKILNGKFPDEDQPTGSTYYWYVGTTQPTDPTNSTQNTGLNKWTSLGTTLPTSSIKVVKEDPTYADHTWYIAAPTAANFVMYNILNTTPELGVKKLNSINIGNVSYDVWKTNSEVDICQVYLHK